MVHCNPENIKIINRVFAEKNIHGNNSMLVIEADEVGT